MKNVTVLGLGYIGLPTVSLLSSHGFNVLGVDINERIISTLRSGKCTIEEPGLPELLANANVSNNLRFSTKPEAADTFLIIVPTPFIEENKEADMRFVAQAAKDISPFVAEGNLIVLESTSTVGATEKYVQQIIEDERPELKGKLHFAFCPERAIPGNTLYELIHNDRVVGGVNEESTKKAIEFYAEFIKGDILPTDVKTAELVKLTENSFRDVNIAFANEMSLVCDRLGLNVFDVVKLANHHPRVNIMTPGPGVGGHCIAIDPWFIHKSAPDITPLIHNARLVNDGKPEWVINQIAKAVAKTGKTKIGLMGLAYKPNVDDMRESPSLKIPETLVKEYDNLAVQICEPYKNMPNFEQVSFEELIQNNDILVMLTGHDDFRTVNAAAFEGKTLIDTCGLYE